MKRAFATLAGGCFVLAVGCADYDYRLASTYAEMKWEKRLNDNLEEAPTKGVLQADLIYVRPPKGLKGPTQTFSLAAVEPGRFDIENSFIDEASKASFHLVARVKKPKAPDAKKGPAPAPAETAPRGRFLDDVAELVKTATGTELSPSEFKPESHTHAGRENVYKTRKLDLGTKEVDVYVLEDPSSVREVALIFDYPKSEVNKISPKIGLCLDCAAIGERARRAFSGSSELEGGAEPEGGAPPPI
jgi:hypothetical protein